jgi:hypothetical protein
MGLLGYEKCQREASNEVKLLQFHDTRNPGRGRSIVQFAPNFHSRIRKKSPIIPSNIPLLLVLRTQRSIDKVSVLFLSRIHEFLPNSLSSSPDLQIADLLHLGLVLLTIIWLGVEGKGSLSLLSGLDRVIKIVEDWLQGVLEASAPVNSTTASSGGAGLVHPIHAVSTNQWVQALSSLLDGLVEGLAGAVALLTEDFILGKEHAVNTTHQATTLTVQVGVDLLLESGLVQVSRSNTNTESNRLLLSVTSNILENGDGGVNSTTLTEESANGAARSLGGNKDNIDISWHINLGLVLEDRGETVGEVEGLKISIWVNALRAKIAYLSLGDLGLNSRPGLTLSSIREQVHDDSTLSDSLINFEEGLSRDPAILLSILPRLTVLSNTNHNIETLVAHVQRLSMTLRTVSNDCHCVILEVILSHYQYVV